MKRIYTIIAIITTFFTSCQDKEIVKQENNPAKVGDEIIFTANSSYEMDARSSRTVYSGNSYTVDGKTYERIEWEAGIDIIGIYCETANNVQYADYRVSTSVASTDKNHEAYLARHEQHSGLQWNGVDEHEFFAIYPSPTIPDQNSSATSLKGRVKLEKNVLTGYVPTTQTPIAIVDDAPFNEANGSKRNADYWAKPDMRYSYMIARTTATIEDASVTLNFQPISTALEIDIDTKNAMSEFISITNITLQSASGKALTGNFTCPIKQDGTPDTESIRTSNTASSLSIQLGTNGVELKKGDVLRVTALMLPTTELNDLKITISGDSRFGGDMIGPLTGLSLTAHKKHYVTNLPLKTPNPNSNMWVGRLNDNILLGSLSIPGTANSFSYAYGSSNEINEDATSIDKHYMTQSSSFENQWNMGVRCFELVSDRQSSATASLGREYLRCNNESLGLTISNAFNKIWEILNASEISRDEFAMIIFSYQPRGGSYPARNPDAYMNNLCEFYNSLPSDIQDNIVLYSPTLTVGDVRGKMMLIARPSQEGEDSDEIVEKSVALGGYKILTIKGWGTLMDKWWRRGYETMIFKGGASSGNVAIEAIDKRDGFSEYPAMEDWIYGTNFTQMTSSKWYPYPTGSKLTTPRPVKGAIRYKYPTDQTGIEAWVQEWRRVVKKDFTVDGTINGKEYSYSFKESMEEKKRDIMNTYERAINDIQRKMVYINSLDGFYMLEDNYESYGPYWVGNMGNIYDYAIDINTYFYNEALSKAAENGTGTMGVILMDYVGVDLNEIKGELLPQIIYNNNFKSQLPTGTPQNSTPGGDNSTPETDITPDNGGEG